MKFLSEETIQLLHQLYQNPGLGKIFRGNQENPVLLLERIEQGAEPLAILPLLYFVFDNNLAIALAAAKAIHTIVNQLSVSQLASLDEFVRKVSFEYRDVWGWNKVRPGNITSLGHLQAYQPAVLGVCSFHNNGYVREQAVIKLGQIWTGKELPFLLIRLNDWVLNVREAANSAVVPRLQPGYAFYFVECLPLVIKLGKRQRIVQSSVVDSVRRLLQAESSLPALHHGFNSPDYFVRRPCYQFALELKKNNLEEIIELATRDQDNRIRLLTVEQIRQLNANPKAFQLLQAFRLDSSMPVRREALRIFIEKFPEQASKEVEKALLDNHWSLRAEARYWTTRNKPVDFVAFYRNALASEVAIDAAIGGLEETGTAADVNLIEPYAGHPLTKNRRAAVKALAKLDPKAYTGLFWRLLFDSSASVCREAARALLLNRHLLDPARLWNELMIASQEHIKQNFLFLIENLSKWDSIYYLIKASLSSDQFISEYARERIRGWNSNYNKSVISPTAVQKVNLIKLLAEAGNSIDFQVRRSIEIVVKSN